MKKYVKPNYDFLLAKAGMGVSRIVKCRIKTQFFKMKLISCALQTKTMVLLALSEFLLLTVTLKKKHKISIDAGNNVTLGDMFI